MGRPRGEPEPAQRKPRAAGKGDPVEGENPGSSSRSSRGDRSRNVETGDIEKNAQRALADRLAQETDRGREPAPKGKTAVGDGAHSKSSNSKETKSFPQPNSRTATEKRSKTLPSFLPSEKKPRRIVDSSPRTRVNTSTSKYNSKTALPVQIVSIVSSVFHLPCLYIIISVPKYHFRNNKLYLTY